MGSFQVTPLSQDLIGCPGAYGRGTSWEPGGCLPYECNSALGKRPIYTWTPQARKWLRVSAEFGPRRPSRSFPKTSVHNSLTRRKLAGVRFTLTRTFARYRN